METNLIHEAPAISARRSIVGIRHTLTWRQVLFYALGAVAAFHLAYAWRQLSVLIGVYLFCLFNLAQVRSPRQAFYIGLAIGMNLFGPQLLFFYTIFNVGAIILWVVLAFWTALYLVLLRMCWANWGRIGLALGAPFLWTGLEYFRSELYYLRFSWLNVGFVFSDTPQMPVLIKLGVYGVGFIFMVGIAAISLLPKKTGFPTGIALLVILGCLIQIPRQFSSSNETDAGTLSIAGVQAEFPTDFEVIRLLDRLMERYPHAKLLVMSEYTLAGAPPQKLKDWCRQRQRYLVVGGKDCVSGDRFFNTVFVLDPSGQIVFRQVKKVPIQFFKDGMPAREQALWNSPWGLIGFCVCYDLSYRRVVDQLVRLGAQALIVPTMDLSDWGAYQHQLHARIAPIRAAEFGIPIFRLASSGISQLVNSQGWILASAPFPGDQATISGNLQLVRFGSLPIDQWITPISVGGTLLLGIWLLLDARLKLKTTL